MSVQCTEDSIEVLKFYRVKFDSQSFQSAMSSQCRLLPVHADAFVVLRIQTSAECYCAPRCVSYIIC
jgi:hypothetical protein